MQRSRGARHYVSEKILPGSHAGGSKVCNATGCNEKTRESKPYCPDHISEIPYVRDMLLVIETRDQEIAEVRKHGRQAVDVRGLVVVEILSHINDAGERTVERLAREVLSGKLAGVLNHYVDAMEGAKLISCGLTRRGSRTVIPRRA